jgi:D-serine deaminase-like pyridoxal phosphate-dependent protein
MIQELEHPYAWLNLDALDANIDFVNQNCGDKAIRIATKSVRSVAALRYIEKKLTNCCGFMTYTAAETLFLVEQGFNRLLIGYPIVEKIAIKKLLSHVRRGVSITFMVDNEAHLEILHSLAEEVDVTVPVCIDINVSTNFPLLYFGSKRSPLTNATKLLQFLRKAKSFSKISVIGVMGYDAQIAGVTDHYSTFGKEKLVQLLKERSRRLVRSWRQHAVAIVKENYNLQFVNGGGSGSIQYSAQQREISEVTVGSAFFAPTLFDRYDSLNLIPAAGFALRVVRQFSEDTFVLQGGGYVASGAVGADRLPAFLEYQRFSFLPLEGAGEVQTPIVDKEKKLKIGDTVLLRHAKAGELCERFLILHCVRGSSGEIYEGPFSTYRGDGQCFL